MAVGTFISTMKSVGWMASPSFVGYPITSNVGWHPQVAPAGTAVATATPSRPPLTGRAATIRIASFNIQVFGESKADKPDVMAVLAETIRRFDIVAIQEVRA